MDSQSNTAEQTETEDNEVETGLTIAGDYEKQTLTIGSLKNSEMVDELFTLSVMNAKRFTLLLAQAVDAVESHGKSIEENDIH